MTLAAQNVEAVLAKLPGIAGKDNVVTGIGGALFSVGGETPAAVVNPATEAQAAEIAKLAHAERIPVTVWGGGTKQGVEPIHPTEGIVLRTGTLSSTIELDAANLTVTVGAGKVVDDLQRELAEAKLFLPLDPVDSARATIGGTLAANTSGPNRLLYRTARDLVLGVRVVTPLGTVIRAGGKTVKDVAGYDMKKLFIGSWGTLGAITAATFRLLPLPEARATVSMVFPSFDGACAAVMTILGSFMRPSTAEILGGRAVADVAPEFTSDGSASEASSYATSGYLLLVLVEGATEDVERQKKELAEVGAKHSAREVAVLEGAADVELWKRRKRVFAEMPAERQSVLVKGSVPLTRVVDLIGGIEQLKSEGLEVAQAAHAGNGIVYALVSASAAEGAKLVGAVQRLQRLAAEVGGFALLQKGPSDVVRQIELWPRRTDYGLMREIKAQLDPANLWNPARTPGGRI